MPQGTRLVIGALASSKAAAVVALAALTRLVHALLSMSSCTVSWHCVLGGSCARKTNYMYYYSTYSASGVAICRYAPLLTACRSKLSWTAESRNLPSRVINAQIVSWSKRRSGGLHVVLLGHSP